MKAAFLLLFIASIVVSPAQNQPTSPPNDKETPEGTGSATDDEDLKSFWQLALPDGHFMVSLDRIASISKHSYLLDGTLIVTEVTIDTVGNGLCRIYQITPTAETGSLNIAQQAAQRAKDLAKRTTELTGSDLSTAVQKTYPTTTHAKTIEYRIQEKATLDALYNSLSKAWVEGKGRKFTIPK